MITYDIFAKNIKENKIGNSYVFCGQDEELMKSAIRGISRKFIADESNDLNYIRLDGNNLTMDEILNACETMPFFGEKKIVVIYRANFLNDKCDSEREKLYKEFKKYLENVPEYTIVISYLLFSDKRETPKKNKKIMALDKISNVVHCDKLKRDQFIRRVGAVFEEKGKNIGNMELRFFCDRVQNNFEIINHEIDKLIAYTYGRDIKKEDIELLISSRSEDDVFDLVDLASQGKINKAMDVMDDILFKSDQHMLIVVSIEKKFKQLYEAKTSISSGKRAEQIAKELKVPMFVCEKIINLSRKYSFKKLGMIIQKCIDTELRLKSSTVDKNMELELLLINIATIK